MEFDQEFVEYIVKNLVNKPEEVRTERKVDEQGVLITVYAADDDIGYLIGKAGRTAIAIRTILATLGAKHNMRISFRINAPQNNRPQATSDDAVSAAPVTSPTDDLAVDSLTF